MNKLIQKYNNQKIKEVMLYILSLTGPISYYQLMKTMFCAERKNLLRWGDSITTLDYFALPHGPVPQTVYDDIIHTRDSLRKPLGKIIKVTNTYTLTPLRDPNLDYLSESDKEAIKSAIEELKDKDYVKTEEYLHEDVYKRVVATPDKRYSHEDIALSAKASETQLNHIRQHEQLQKYLS